MTKEQKYKALLELIYEATRQDIEIKFSKDLEGQMLVSFGGNGSGHIHAGSPGGSLDQAVRHVSIQLANVIETVNINDFSHPSDEDWDKGWH